MEVFLVTQYSKIKITQVIKQYKWHSMHSWSSFYRTLTLRLMESVHASSHHQQSQQLQMKILVTLNSLHYIMAHTHCVANITELESAVSTAKLAGKYLLPPSKCH